MPMKMLSFIRASFQLLVLLTPLFCTGMDAIVAKFPIGVNKKVLTGWVYGIFPICAKGQS